MTAGKHTAAQARVRVAVLERIVRDTLWMARRYAHGRQSYAVSMYNEAARCAVALGIKLDMPDGSVFAVDGMDRGAGRPVYSGLTAEEFAAAVAGLNTVGTTPHPDRFSEAAKACPETPPQAPIQDQGQDRSSDRRGGA